MKIRPEQKEKMLAFEKSLARRTRIYKHDEEQFVRTWVEHFCGHRCEHGTFHVHGSGGEKIEL